MFEVLARLHELKAFAEATGLGLGGLALCAAVIVWVPVFRQIAIAAAITVGCSYASSVYFAHVEGAAVRADWAAADARAKAAAAARDVTIDKILAGEFSADDNNQVDADAAKILAALSAAAGGACRLGSDALRLRERH